MCCVPIHLLNKFGEIGGLPNKSDQQILNQGRCLLLLLRIGSAHLGIFGFLKEFAHLYNNNFARFKTMWKKQSVSKGYRNPKRKLGVTTHFSEIIELKFGKKLPYILCILTPF